MTTKLAMTMARFEGFFVQGSVPQRNNNPLDLRHAPEEEHLETDPNGVGWFATPEEGWAMGERQLELYAGRDLTIGEMIGEFAPVSENDTGAYLDFVCKEVGCQPTDKVADVLKEIE